MFLNITNCKERTCRLNSIHQNVITANRRHTCTLHKFIEDAWPPSVTNNWFKCACSLDRTLMKFSKSSSLLRDKKSSSCSLRSRSWTRATMCCLCGHVMQPALFSSVTKATLESMRSTRWILFTVSARIRDSFKGSTTPDSAAISVVQIIQGSMINRPY